MNKVEWTKRAHRQLREIPADYKLKILEKVGLLENYPQCAGDIKQLANRPEKRLRVGRYRVIFNHESEIEIISIEEVKKRDDRTY